MKNTFLSVIVGALLAALLFGTVISVSYSMKLHQESRIRQDYIERQKKLIATQAETIALLESWIEVTDPDYVIVWRRPCVENWGWPMWAKEIKEGRPPPRCWSGCDW